MFRPNAAALLTLACLSMGSACGPSARNCPNQSAPTCPAVVPDFGSEVFPIFQAVCDNCHRPGGTEASVPLTSYAEITSPRFKTTAFSQILGCAMPPSNAPVALSESDRQILLAWFACGTPAVGTTDAGAPDGGTTDGGDTDGSGPDL